MSDEPAVPVVCPACETSSTVPLAAVAETVDRHNANHHDGDAVATVDPDLKARLADLVAEDLGLLEESN